MPQQPDVLLVEDNLDDVALALRAFRLAKLTAPVVVVHDGVEALNYLFGCGKQALPKLIVLDLKLPGVDGIEVLKAIRADPRTRLIPVLMLTSSMLDEDVVACYTLGANSYLVKPIDFAQFVEMMISITNYWLKINHNAPTQVRA